VLGYGTSTLHFMRSTAHNNHGATRPSFVAYQNKLQKDIKDVWYACILMLDG